MNWLSCRTGVILLEDLEDPAAYPEGIGFIVPVKTVSEFTFKLSPFFLKIVITERLALASSALVCRHLSE